MDFLYIYEIQLIMLGITIIISLKSLKDYHTKKTKN